MSGSSGLLGCMKRSSGDGVKRSRSRPGWSLGGTTGVTLGAATAAHMPAITRTATAP